MPATPTILQPAVILERISRLNLINTTLQKTLGFQRGGPRVRTSPMGRRGSYDVFNDTREVAGATGPGAPANRINRQIVGNVPFQIPRSSEAMHMLYEQIHAFRRIGGPVGEIDAMGQQYIFDQERIVAQRIANLREFQTAAMLRGSYTFSQGGLGEFSHAFSGGAFTVNYQIPAGNKTKLNMLGAGDILATSWDNAAAPIITDCFQIQTAFNQLIGRGLSDVILTSVGWGYVLANTQVQNQAGSVNQVFDYITKNEEDQTFTAKLKALPWVTWHINDSGVNLNGTFTKLIEDDHAVFLPQLTDEMVSYWECGAPVVEYDGGPAVERVGEYYYAVNKAEPARIELVSEFNGLPVLKNPQGVAYGLIKY